MIGMGTILAIVFVLLLLCAATITIFNDYL